jgi:penicillin-binding protein 2
MRTKVFSGIFTVTLAFLGIYLFKIQVVDHGRLSDLARRNYIKALTVPHTRGKLLDRNGAVLADWTPEFRVSVIPEKIDSAYFHQLREVLGKGPDLDSLRLSTGYVPFAEGVDLEQVVYLEERLETYPWLTISVIPRRHYPMGSAFAHVLGYIGKVTEADMRVHPEYGRDQWIGRMGAEKAFERPLRGEDGHRFLAVSARGRIVQEDPRPMIPPVSGTNLRLTLDASLQLAADSLFESFERGACVALDPRTGDILVLYSKPAFDPNSLSRGVSEAEWDSLLTSASSPLLNRATCGLYPPGSIFKLVSAMIGVDLDRVDRDTRLAPCRGAYTFGNRTWRCWKPEGHGWVDLLEAVEVSCDVYFYQLGRDIGLETFLNELEDRGLPPRFEIDFPEIRRGFAPTMEWYDRQYGSRGYGPGNVLNLVIGQGEILMTPIEISLLTAAVAWEGQAESPSLLTRGRLASKEHRARKVTLGFSTEAVRIAREGMHRAVMGENATGYAARIPGLELAGKTGTAENPRGEDHSLFTCFAPYDSPEIVVTVVVENAGHGSTVAAPIAGSLLEKYFLEEEPEDLEARTP